jgi:hypothetical protein
MKSDVTDLETAVDTDIHRQTATVLLQNCTEENIRQLLQKKKKKNTQFVGDC